MEVAIGGASSVGSTGIGGKRGKELMGKEDRISDLPDSLIHHILSFLPSTKQAIQTGVLSKRWLKQWTRVPVLIFDISSISSQKFCRCIDNTLILHNCSKIKKFHVRYSGRLEIDSELTAEIRFATMKYVEELILNFNGSYRKYRLPKFIFINSSLVKLEIVYCIFAANEKVNWEFLKILKIEHCDLTDDVIGNVLSGSPSLESLELSSCNGFERLVVASKRLKRLVLREIRRPYLIEISCPNLEDLILFQLEVLTLKMLNLASLIRATFQIFLRHEYSAKEILEQVQNVKELELEVVFVEPLKYLSAFQLGTLPFPLLNCKRLNLEFVNSDSHHAVIAFALCNSPVLENLVLKKRMHQPNHCLPDLNDSEENFWTSNESIFKSSVSHMKTVKIDGLWGFKQYKLVLNFVEFILKNARVLEKLVVILQGGGMDFVIEVSNKLLSFPKFSQHAIVELCYS